MFCQVLLNAGINGIVTHIQATQQITLVTYSFFYIRSCAGYVWQQCGNLF